MDNPVHLPGLSDATEYESDQTEPELTLAEPTSTTYTPIIILSDDEDDLEQLVTQTSQVPVSEDSIVVDPSNQPEKSPWNKEKSRTFRELEVEEEEDDENMPKKKRTRREGPTVTSGSRSWISVVMEDKDDPEESMLSKQVTVHLNISPELSVTAHPTSPNTKPTRLGKTIRKGPYIWSLEAFTSFNRFLNILSKTIQCEPDLLLIAQMTWKYAPPASDIFKSLINGDSFKAMVSSLRCHQDDVVIHVLLPPPEQIGRLNAFEANRIKARFDYHAARNQDSERDLSAQAQIEAMTSATQDNLQKLCKKYPLGNHPHYPSKRVFRQKQGEKMAYLELTPLRLQIWSGALSSGIVGVTLEIPPNSVHFDIKYGLPLLTAHARPPTAASPPEPAPNAAPAHNPYPYATAPQYYPWANAYPFHSPPNFYSVPPQPQLFPSREHEPSHPTYQYVTPVFAMTSSGTAPQTNNNMNSIHGNAQPTYTPYAPFPMAPPSSTSHSHPYPLAFAFPFNPYIPGVPWLANRPQATDHDNGVSANAESETIEFDPAEVNSSTSAVVRSGKISPTLIHIPDLSRQDKDVWRKAVEQFETVDPQLGIAMRDWPKAWYSGRMKKVALHRYHRASTYVG
ncbi:hypothetical protein H0H93_008713 [Arthromyces matolae]|nr:hypothetical protein H0H93_008713 [Arthromyces matolae]